MATLVPRSCLTLCFMLSLLTLALPGSILAKNCGGPVPCECGDFLVASRTLVAGVDPITVTPCPDIGLSIWVSDLTLDLNGNTIRAAAGAGSYGIALNTSSGITVTGGTIVGFGYGIYCRLSDHNRFSFLQIVEGGDGIIILGDANTIERSVFRRQQGNAIFAWGEGTQVLANRIEDSQYSPSAGARVLIDRSDPILPDLGPTVIARNVILRSAGAGLEVAAPSFPEPLIAGTLVDHNQVSRSGGDGLVLSGWDLQITRNLSTDNGRDGFHSQDLSVSTFDGNRAEKNGRNGLTFDGTGHTVVRNVAKNNAEDGLFVEAIDSTFDRNQSLANGGLGIEDTTAGDGTADTANTYTLNSCSSANALGTSSPAGLCR